MARDDNDADAAGPVDRADGLATRQVPDGTKPIRVLHGPNLNLLGERDPEVYGATTLAEIEELAAARAEQHGLVAEFLQTNHEGVLVDAVQECGRGAAGLILNPGALTHYSRALGDAVAAVKIPVIEVHLSNVHAREDWRRLSVVSPYVTGTIAGFRSMGYVFAVDALAVILSAGPGGLR